MKKFLLGLLIIVVVISVLLLDAFVMAKAEEIPGVTVVGSEDIMTYPDWVYVVLIGSGVAAILFLIFGAYSKHSYYFPLFSFVFCAVLFLSTLIYMAVKDPCVYDYTKYYITVTDETPMNAFNGKYRVIGEHGNLLVVVENDE